MKQKNMLKRNLLKVASWTLAHTSWITMTLSPVALGKQAEKNSVEFYKQQIRSIGLDKKMTAQEFWNNVKNDLPGYAYYEIEQAVKQNPNAIMPQFEVKSSKNSDGQTVPVISFTENGKTTTLQMYGEKEKFMKYGNTVLTENEAHQPSVLFQKLIDNDPKLNQQYKNGLQKELQLNSAKSTSANFAPIDQKLWKTMSAEQRVSYIIYMRQLYLDAQNVLKEKDNRSQAPNKKTSSMNIFEILFKGLVPDVEAQDAEVWAIVNGKKVKVTTNAKAKSCIVAGYVSQEAQTSEGRTVCSVEVALKKDRYQPKADSPIPFVSGANQACQSKDVNLVACNPIVYSYKSDGTPHCIDRSSAVFQTATHWGSDTCDGQSKLTNQQEKALKNTTDYKNLSQADLDRTGNLALSKEFIKNYLKSSGKQDFVDCLQSSILTAKCSGLISEITKIGENFKKDINSALAICNAGTGTADSKQSGACDQIRKRWLSYEALISALKCEDGSKPVNGKCSTQPEIQCPEGSTQVLSEKDDRMCSCADLSKDPSSSPILFKPTESLPKKCQKNTDGLTCPKGSDPATPDEKGMCACVIPADQDNDAQKISFKAGEALPEACARFIPDPSVKCDQYPPLKVGIDLNSDCSCKNAEGANGNIPKEDQPGFLAKLFNSKKNKAFKATTTDKRPHSCKFGPNWWLVGAGALVVGGITALLLTKKTKTETKTETKTIDNTVTCTLPKYPAIVGYSSTNQPTYNCVCVPCGKYYLQNGTSVEITPNPLTCACEPPPSEGGTTPPSDDSGSGGVPSQN